MKIFNRKLAKRIKDNEKAETALVNRLATCDLVDFNTVRAALADVRKAIALDCHTLHANGFYSTGKRIRWEAAPAPKS